MLPAGEPPVPQVNPTIQIRSFIARSHHGPGQWSASHYHREWEIVFIQRGSGIRCIGDSVEKFTAGDLVIIPGGLAHVWHWNAGQKPRCTVLHFLPQAWGTTFWELTEIQAFRRLCEKAGGGARFSGRGVAQIGGRMEALTKTDSATLASLSELLGIFSRMTDLECYPLNAQGAGNGTRRNPLLEDLLAWVAANLRGGITQQEAADRMKMNPSSFCRWFKMNAGCSFKRYVNEIRVAKVCARITRGDQSITEAAFAAGYNNLSNFNRHFLNITGVTPSAFRDRHRKSVE
ncbi:AraC family transcriptional regulator [Luteolibacter sp. LG18]|uniref:AraC family transcriptional regulator n=1 Tax=Luteolibacter sp. LG18 TaxID=2819286 RepID=UPI002B2D4F13|nr:AraC family transcriptional regulator [Luteolibacter sp. LG18]